MTDTPKFSKTVTITNKRGLHARASARFVSLVEQFSDVIITVTKDNQTVTGDSIMGLMMLGASYGTDITITANSTDIAQATKALSHLVDLLYDKFGETE